MTLCGVRITFNKGLGREIMSRKADVKIRPVATSAACVVRSAALQWVNDPANQAATVAALDEARADVSRDEYIAAVVTPLHE